MQSVVHPLRQAELREGADEAGHAGGAGAAAVHGHAGHDPHQEAGLPGPAEVRPVRRALPSPAAGEGGPGNTGERPGQGEARRGERMRKGLDGESNGDNYVVKLAK